jgi:hypothetical protein
VNVLPRFRRVAAMEHFYWNCIEFIQHRGEACNLNFDVYSRQNNRYQNFRIFVAELR